jgi:hypothetical protein
MNDTEARAILRGHGEPVTGRGKLSARLRARAQHLADQDAGDGAAAPVEDVVDFGEAVAGDPAGLPDPGLGSGLEERPPPRPKRERLSLRDAFKRHDGKKPATPRRRVPRVPVDHLVAEFWALLGGVAQRVDVPVGRCLSMQAPVAGLIMEDIVKGTMVDRALQPLARVEDKAKAAGALILPPLLVAGIEHAQTLPEDARRAREALLWPLLVESMVLWERIAGDKAEELLARAEEEAPSRERAQQLAVAIFQGLGTPQAEPVAEPAPV